MARSFQWAMRVQEIGSIDRWLWQLTRTMTSGMQKGSEGNKT